MSQFGMGVLYEKTDNGDVMRQVTPDLRARILNEFYHLHHRALTEAVQAQLDRTGTAMIVDCHSFPDVPFNRSLNTRRPRPDFNIGTDPHHTPKELIHILESFFREKGYSVGIDWPYSGTITPMAFYQKNRSVHSVMLEVNRKLYLNPESNEKSGQYTETKRIVQEFLTVVRSWHGGRL